MFVFQNNERVCDKKTTNFCVGHCAVAFFAFFDVLHQGLINKKNVEGVVVCLVLLSLAFKSLKLD